MNHTTIRKWMLYGGAFFLAIATFTVILANSSRFTAEVATQPLCVADADTGLMPSNCTGGTTTGTSILPCKEVTATTDTTTTALTATTDCGDTCAEGNPPSDVPGSVKSSRDAADTTAAGTQPEVTAVATATKADIESGSIKTTIEQAGQKVYDTEAQAKQEMQKVWDTNIVPKLRIEYYELGWTKVNGRTNTSGNQAKGFFGSQYSKDPNKWGPQATGQYTFLRNGSGNITGRATIGGFTWNGQQLGSGFADLSLRATWNIAGDTLQGVAAYDCEIGNASGNTSVTGKWTNVGVQANIPVWIKKNSTSAYKVTLQFGVNFVEKRITIPFALGWNF